MLTSRAGCETRGPELAVHRRGADPERRPGAAYAHTKLPPRPRTPRPAPALTVKIISLPPAGQRNVATATAQTVPDANCSILVEYNSGPSTAQGLYPKTASASGTVAWSWIVGARTTPGSWPVTVTCSQFERRGSERT